MGDKKVDYIKYYKNSIEKHQNDPERVLHCLKKLENVRIDVQHLQDTGIGRTVNAVRGLDGEAGELANNLVNKWKSIVSENEHSDKNEEREEITETIAKKSHHHHSKSSSMKSSSKEKENGKKSKHHHHHHSSTSSSHHQSSSGSHHTSTSHSKEHKKSSNDSKSNENKHKSSNSNHDSSSQHKAQTSSSSSSSKKRSHEEVSLDAKDNELKAKRLKIETEKSDKKKSSSSSNSKSNESKEHSSSSNNKSSSKNKEHKHSSKRKSSEDDSSVKEFDGSTGEIGFAEALMMFDMPSTSKSKKQLADKIVTVKSSSSSKDNKSSSSKSTSKDNKHKSTSSSSATSSSSSSRPSTLTSAEAEASESKKSLKTLTQPPKLLTQKPALGLLPDLVSDITIPDYRPLPLNHAMKDYIDSNFGSFESRHSRKADEVVQFAESFSSKANRTKVFSGNSKARMQIPKLFDLCIRVLQENIDFLECTGGVPFEILKPVLERAKPDQLSVIEYYNPYLLEESDILWKPHCQRKWKNKQPAEMETWREMYERCTKEDEEKLNRLTQNIKHQQEKSLNGIQKTKMAYVDSFVKPPRGIMRKQEQFGTNRKLVASPAARVEALKNLAPNIVSGQHGDVRLRVAAGLRDDAQQVVGRGNIQRGSLTKKAPLMAKILQKFKR
ncbi:hypothetical protein PVAND_002583 [Polypedilum vanderplanki]|uniref:TFIIS N-terminal domain-containing protein n=1 Tax=Polypedilum vanderplanki TaxID=319348 RepID=A0A9J6BRX8_POLVA|nr:hypothetical protein PVAND_002583 [Polypedilum vanderplanki]